MVDPDGNELIDSSGNFVGDLEVESGDAIVDSSGNEMLEFTVTASAVNHVGISNTGTGVSPVFIAEGEANTGFDFVNSEAEEVLILDSIATSVNELTISSAATGSGPILAATGDDTNVDVNINPKGAGNVLLDGGVVYSEITSTSGAGAVAITGGVHEVTTTGTGDALTLANGTAGQRLCAVYVAEGAGGDTAVITPTTLAGGSTITLNDLGDSCDLVYSSTGGWYVLGLGGAAAVA